MKKNIQSQYSQKLRNLLIGVTGSVAAIKIDNLALSLLPYFNIKIIFTQSALKFITQQQHQNLRINKIQTYTDDMEWKLWQKRGDPVLHIQLRKWAHLLVIAPLSANTLAKISHGLSDNLITLICRAWCMKKQKQLLINPIFICPAMNSQMWEHPVTSEQLQILKSWGYRQIGPIQKILMCGEKGKGAMSQIKEIQQVLRKWAKQANNQDQRA